MGRSPGARTHTDGISNFNEQIEIPFTPSNHKKADEDTCQAVHNFGGRDGRCYKSICYGLGASLGMTFVTE
jgi:hypothetical protein